MDRCCDMLLCEDDGFADFVFDIVRVKNKIFGGIYIECAAVDDDVSVRFGIEFAKNMRGLVDNDPYTFKSYPNGMTMRSLGSQSDMFIRRAAHRYGLDAGDLHLRKRSSIVCGALHGDPSNLLREYVEFKCFVATDDEDRYAEFYINVDIPNRKLYFKEKDIDYRENIIRYFGEK